MNKYGYCLIIPASYQEIGVGKENSRHMYSRELPVPSSSLKLPEFDHEEFYWGIGRGGGKKKK